MADKGKSVGALYLSLGLDMTPLESAYLQADKTITENMWRLQRQISQNKLKLQIDLGDASLTDAQKTERRIAALTEQLELQRQKANLAAKAWDDMKDSVDRNSYVGHQAYQQMQREALAAQQLANQLAELSKATQNVSLDKVAAHADLLKAKLENINLQRGLIGGDSTLSELQKITEQERLLTQQIELQKQAVAAAERQWRREAETNGEASLAARNLSNEYLRQKTILQQLQGELQNTAKAKGAMGKSHAIGDILNLTPISPVLTTVAKSLADMANKAKEAQKALDGMGAAMKTAEEAAALKRMSTLFGQLKTEAQAALDVFSSLPVPLKAAAAALGTVGAAIALDKMAASAIKGKSDMNALAENMHMAVSETAKLSTACKMAGQDLGYISTNLQRMEKSVITAGEKGNETTQMLEQFGVKVTDANGKLLDHLTVLKNLSAGYQRAKKDGKATEFMLQTLGMRGKEAAYFLDQLPRLLEAAGRVKKINLLAGISPEEINEARTELEIMGTELSQFGTILPQALTPFAAETMPHINRLLGTAITLINEMGPTISWVSDKAGEGANLVIDALNTLLATITAVGDAGKDIYSIFVGDKDFSAIWHDSTKLFNAINLDTRKAIESVDDYREHLGWTATKIAQLLSGGNEERFNQITQSLYDNWRNMEEGRTVATQKANSDIAGSYESMADRTGSAIEKVALWGDANYPTIEQQEKRLAEAYGQRADAADIAADREVAAAERAADAAARAADRVQNATQRALDEIYQLTHTQYENDIYKAWRDANRMYDEGVPVEIINRLSTLKIQQAQYNDELRRTNQLSRESGRNMGKMADGVRRTADGFAYGAGKVLEYGRASQKSLERTRSSLQRVSYLASRPTRAAQAAQAMDYAVPKRNSGWRNGDGPGGAGRNVTNNITVEVKDNVMSNDVSQQIIAKGVDAVTDAVLKAENSSQYGIYT